jgi:adenosylcobinamide kinase / adenosylcobinamide-phosphate guanylyltransferase
MHATTLIVGGCRSGKSRHALELGDAMLGRRKLFVATCVPQDQEMRERVDRHKEERGSHWQTLEAPLDLPDALSRHGPRADLVIVDCLTLWISNLMLAHAGDAHAIDRHIDQLCAVLNRPPCPMILVTNEVGAGIVPENRLARHFRDWVGRANQRAAAACRQVIWMVAGIAVPVKKADS